MASMPQRRRKQRPLLALLVQSAVCDIAIKSGWEVAPPPPGNDDAHGNLIPVIGTFGNIGETLIVETGCYNGESCLEATESPLSGTPEIYLAWVSNLNQGDIVKATVWAKGGPTSEVGLCGHYTDEADDYNSFDESAGCSEEKAGAGKVWEKLSYSFTVEEDKEALLVAAKLYCYDEDDATVWIDDLKITVTSVSALVATSPAWASDFGIEDGEPLGVDTNGANNVEVEIVSSGCRSPPGCFKATEEIELEGTDWTPKILIATVHNLSPFDHVYAHAWFKGDGGDTEGQLYATYFDTWGVFAGDHDDGGGSLVGQDNQWGLSEFVWPIHNGRTGLQIEARTYVFDPAHPSILIDDILVSTNSTTAYVTVAPVSPSTRGPGLIDRDRLKKAVKVAALTATAARLIGRVVDGPTRLMCIDASDACVHSEDGDCDDGGAGAEFSSCEYGHDCTDCGPRPMLDGPPPPPPSPSPPPPLGEGGLVCYDSCDHSRDGSCDDGGPNADTDLCEGGSDCSDCGDRYAYPPPPPLNHICTGATHRHPLLQLLIETSPAFVFLCYLGFF